MKIFVVDSSFVLSFLLPDEDVEYVNTFFLNFAEKQISIAAPTILSFEVINGLKSATIRKRISHEDAIKLVDRFERLHIPQLSIDPIGVLELSIEKKLSVYDASYAWLARSYGCPLMTHDRQLRRLVEKERR